MKSQWEAGVSHGSTNHVAGFKWRGGPERICRHYSLMTFVSVDFTAVSSKPSLPSVLLTGPLPLSRFLFVSRSLVLSLSLSNSPHSFLELFRFRWRDFMQFLLICLLLQECLYDFFQKFDDFLIFLTVLSAPLPHFHRIIFLFPFSFFIPDFICDFTYHYNKKKTFNHSSHLNSHYLSLLPLLSDRSPLPFHRHAKYRNISLFSFQWQIHSRDENAKQIQEQETRPQNRSCC